MRLSLVWIEQLLPWLAETLEAKDQRDEAGRLGRARRLAAKLTGGGLEVEAIIPFGIRQSEIEPIVAQVVAIDPHPTKSGLRLVTVDQGSGRQQVVCGAPNVPPPGGLVVLAPLGAHLPDAMEGGLTIAPRAIAGVTSEGMLCSERELGLLIPGRTEPDAGILILPTGLPIGSKLSVAIPTSSDIVLEIGVTPNRPDALGHIGLAREISALFGRRLPTESDDLLTLDEHIRLTIDPAALDRCPHYAATIISAVQSGPSTLEVRYRLHALGLRSISNVVDVTNLVLMERCHPLHAFDLDKVEGKSIHVRTARAGESLKTLDGQLRALDPDDLLICDGNNHPIALAGVMGGFETEISESTRSVLLECAYFDPRSVRRTARRHGLHSEASHRFERGIDPNGVSRVISSASQLLARCAHATAPVSYSEARGNLPVASTIMLRPTRVTRLLGLEVASDVMTEILQNLGCLVQRAGESLQVTAPSFRPDLIIEEDLIEEIARVHGYDQIPTILPPVRHQVPRSTGVFETKLRRAAVACGLSETVNFAFANGRELAMVGAPKAVVEIQNPLGEERKVLRTSLLPALLHAAARSQRHGANSVTIFEVATRFLAGGPEHAKGLCDEVPSFAALLLGRRDTWLGRGDEFDVYDIKGLVESLLAEVVGSTAAITIVPIELPAERAKALHPRGAAKVVLGEQEVGTLGPIHPDLADSFGLNGACMLLELDVRTLSLMAHQVPQFKALATLPAVARDLAFEVDELLRAGELLRLLKEGAGPLCEGVELFDLYRGKGVADGKKSLAFRLTYRDPTGSRTLTDGEIEKLQTAAVSRAKTVGATLRG